MKQPPYIITFSDEELIAMLNYHGVITIKDDEGLIAQQFMSKKQYDLMYPEDRQCPYDDEKEKGSAYCGSMDLCNICVWWNEFTKIENTTREERVKWQDYR